MSACTGPARRGSSATSEKIAEVATPSSTSEVDDRLALAALTRELGRAASSPLSEDALTLDDARIDLGERALMGTVEVTGKTFRARVHTLQLAPKKPCLLGCVARLRLILDEWLGPPSVAREGDAEFFHYRFDTTHVTFEHYPKRPALNRLILVCEPLASVASGRRPGLRPKRRVPLGRSLPRCRSVPVHVGAVSR